MTPNKNSNRLMEIRDHSKNGASLKRQKSKGNLKYLVLTACLFITFAGQAQTIRYVKLSGIGDGSSWANAADNIQTMIDASASGDQVWIASGTYLLSATLQMKEGVNVYGGFFGNETNITNRPKSDLDDNGIIEDWEFTNATILDGQNARQVLNQANSFEIETVWDGVTITKGRSSSGAGAYIRTNGKLNNCIVTQNNKDVITSTYTSYGGGIYNDGGTVNNCTVYGNAIRVSFYGSTLRHVYVAGAGIYNYRGTISNCMIFDNYCHCETHTSTSSASSAQSYGGGIYNKEGIVNTCCIYNNGVSSSGGYISYSGVYGGGIYNSGTVSNKTYIYCSTILNNGKNNTSGSCDKDGCHILEYNCITENSNLEQNFIRSTSFVGQAGDDAQKAELLRASWRLKQGSQYIEAGSLADLPDWVINGTDLAGNPRVSNGKISIGAYEFDPKTNAIKLTHFNNGIKVYPNPVSESFSVDYEGFIQVKIYDILGKEILFQDTNSKTEININYLPKGIYNVRIISEGRIIGNSKIVKQ